MHPLLIGFIVVVIFGTTSYVVWKKSKTVTPTQAPSSKPWIPNHPSAPVCLSFESNVVGHGPTGTIYPFNKETNVLGPDSSTLFSPSDLVFTQPNATFPFVDTFTFLPTNKFAPCTSIGANALISKTVLQDLFTFFTTKVVILTPGCGFYTAKGNIPVLVMAQPIVPTGFVCRVNLLINNAPNGTKMDIYVGPNASYQIGPGTDVYYMSQVNLKSSASDSPSNMNDIFTFGGCPGNQFISATMITKQSLQQLLPYLSSWKYPSGAGFYDSTTNQPIAIL